MPPIGRLREGSTGVSIPSLLGAARPDAELLAEVVIQEVDGADGGDDLEVVGEGGAVKDPGAPGAQDLDKGVKGPFVEDGAAAAALDLQAPPDDLQGH